MAFWQWEPGIEDITVAALQEMTDEDSEIISVYYGQDVSEEDAEHLAERLEESVS